MTRKKNNRQQNFFTAIEIPEDVAFQLELMRGGLVCRTWVERDSYHITLRYMRDVKGHVRDELFEALADGDHAPFELELQGAGSFGNADPRAVWIGVAANTRLRDLQASQEATCRRFCLKPESRQFTPHVTLARRCRASVDEVQGFIARNNLSRSRPFAVERFVVMSSVRSTGGGPYRIEEAYPLVSAM